MSRQEIHSLEELKNWAKSFSNELSFKDIVLLEGEMGVGKSQLVQYLVESLSQDQSCSPTYAIHNCYKATNGASIDHIDLYRVEDEDDLESTGFWDLFGQDQAVILIEWADRMDASIYPKAWNLHRIQLQKIDESSRVLELSKLS